MMPRHRSLVFLVTLLCAPLVSSHALSRLARLHPVSNLADADASRHVASSYQSGDAAAAAGGAAAAAAPTFPGPNLNPPICPAITYTASNTASGVITFTKTTNEKPLTFVDVHVTAGDQFLNYRMTQANDNQAVYTRALPADVTGPLSYWFTYVAPDAEGVLRGCDTPVSVGTVVGPSSGFSPTSSPSTASPATEAPVVTTSPPTSPPTVFIPLMSVCDTTGISFDMAGSPGWFWFRYQSSNPGGNTYANVIVTFGSGAQYQYPLQIDPESPLPNSRIVYISLARDVPGTETTVQSFRFVVGLRNAAGEEDSCVTDVFTRGGGKAPGAMDPTNDTP